MSKITRKTAQIFGVNATSQQIAQFGSFAAGSAAYSTDPAVIQSLSNWLSGWFAAVVGQNSPEIEDVNAFCYVMSYQIAYMLQQGIGEWDSGTTYYTNSLVESSGLIYISLQDSNTNNAVSNTSFWKVICANPMTSLGDMVYGVANGVPTRLAGNTSTAMQFLTQTGTGSVSTAPVWQTPKAPTVQIFSSGSGTYNLPSGPAPIYIRVIVLGGGGGGSGSGVNSGGAGGTGGNTSFGTSLLVANGGGGGGGAFSSPELAGGVGGTASLGSGPVGIAITGGIGAPGISTSAAGASGSGASSPLGGAGGGNSVFQTTGQSAVQGSGSGGGGASINTSGTQCYGAGGGAGGYIDAIITSPNSTYAYTVGAGGTAGTSGTSGATGGVGGFGVIIVTEYYQ